MSAQPPSRAAIEVQDLVKTYPGDVRALDGVTFEVAPGTVFALLGPNGAGKTTTMKVLTTLTRPDSGIARVAGLDVTRDAQRVRRAIGVVAQRSGVDRNATGRENLALQGRLFGMRGAALTARVDGLLGAVGLADVADRNAGGYSGGMQRRLDIALGLVHAPSVLFLDEPTTGLDPEVRAAMWEEIGRLAREESLTILLTTHYLEEADRRADRLAILDAGRVVAIGTPSELKAELHGEAIAIGVRESGTEPAVRAALAPIPGLEVVRLEDRTVHVRVPVGATALPGVLAALDAHGVAVASATVSRPSLDDVYLRHAGRSFAAAERVTTQEAPR